MAGFRDTLIHGYFGIDIEILWDIIVHKDPIAAGKIITIIEFEKNKNT